ncbi:amino acid ABC transporter membrane protein (PAAT family) [Mobilisporobacter senegalensis]|uniref:Amino acid ABC transporter membrane protein (PAAT family) n=1 Tax=Mobilisporobacter senegalensis TaxID=1329262 RepID=A0A3N1XNU7_9FIRM|nr:amino acid ABC transporter membrane protein (PAAT family) [Mobilisporobacter senegalensis]
MSPEAILKLLQYMITASAMVGKIFFLTLLFSLPLGLLACFGRMSKWAIIREPVKLYLLIMRGTPLILQLFFFFYFPYYVIGTTLPRFHAAILTCSINYAAYFAEIYRGGIESMPKGQYEAAKVLGFNKSQTFIKIILPQVIKRILPPMGNEFMTLVKDTALVSVIGVAELYQLATDTMSQSASTMPLVMAGAFYLAMNIIVSKGFEFAEKKMSYYR